MDLVSELFALPTGVFTVLLAFILLYWIVFMLGAIDIDALGGADGAVEGALEGAVEGAVEGALESAAEGAAEAALGGAAEGGAEAGLGPIAGLVSALRLRSVPVTVLLSFVVLIGWTLSYFGMRWLDPLLPAPFAALLVTLGATAGGVLGASLAIRPFARVFESAPGRRRRDLIGELAVITTGHVDRRFGQARCDVAGATLLIDVRALRDERIPRGQEVLIVDYDDDAHAYLVEASTDMALEG